MIVVRSKVEDRRIFVERVVGDWLVEGDSVQSGPVHHETDDELHLVVVDPEFEQAVQPVLGLQQL